VGILTLIAVCLVTSWLTTGLVRRYALARSILDVPNDRSSHSVPTPRGGGLAIALVLPAGLTAAAAAGWVDRELALALGVGGALVAGIGWIDDHRHVPARVRVGVHFAASVWAVWRLGGLDSLRLGAFEVPLGPVGPVVAVLGIVWLINLYNFMDGIDGIAGGEALAVGLAGAALTAYTGEASVAVASLLVAAGAAGFLVWNRPPARIFMGDVGSGLLGFAFGALALASETRGSVPLLLWLVLLGVFVADATATLLRRVVHGERWYDAHRSHAYQRAVRAGWSHGGVTVASMLLTGLLALLVAAAVIRPSLQPVVAVAAVLLLGAGYLAVERVWPMYRRR
jgi:Fuc2NAc and GlcNAc transferase